MLKFCSEVKKAKTDEDLKFNIFELDRNQANILVEISDIKFLTSSASLSLSLSLSFYCFSLTLNMIPDFFPRKNDDNKNTFLVS